MCASFSYHVDNILKAENFLLGIKQVCIVVKTSILYTYSTSDLIHCSEFVVATLAKLEPL